MGPAAPTPPHPPQRSKIHDRMLRLALGFSYPEGSRVDCGHVLKVTPGWQCAPDDISLADHHHYRVHERIAGRGVAVWLSGHWISHELERAPYRVQQRIVRGCGAFTPYVETLP